MLQLLLFGTALAADAELMPMGPLIADGVTPARIQVAVPGAMPGDKVKLKPFEGTASGGAVTAPGVVSFSFLAPRRYQDDGSQIRLIVKGSVSVDETFTVPLEPVPKSELEISFTPESWTVGERGTVEVRIGAAGQHPLPASARPVMLEADMGKVTGLSQAEDGSWKATWTPPTVKTPTNVLFTATDLSSPDEVVGQGAFALKVKATQEIKASSGSQNVLVIGTEQYGPATAGEDNKVSFEALLDPRVTDGTLQSVDETGYRSDTTVPLELGSPAAIAFAPLPSMVPTGRDIVLHVALMEPDGSAWSGAAPKMEGASEAESLGKGWYAFEATAPMDPGAWNLTVTADGELSASRKLTVIDSVPDVTLSAEPQGLAPGKSAFKVTAHLKDADGTALIKRRPTFTAEGASLQSGPKDNGDGTYTSRYVIHKSVDSARITVHASPKATGLPVARLALWPMQGSVEADGSSTTDIAIVAEDAWGMPVPNVEVTLTTPIGDGAIKPTAKTDRYGFAAVSYRAGTSAGPAAVVADAKGIVGTTVLYQHPPGTDPVGVEPAGAETDLARAQAWRSARPAIQVSKVGADVGPPARVAITTTPGYTTPGAAILVTVRVLDANGKAVLTSGKPKVSSSIGKVGAITNNGDGSFNLPLQLPPGQDGPVTITATASGVTGTQNLPTLASLGGAPPPPQDKGKDKDKGKDDGDLPDNRGKDPKRMDTRNQSVRLHLNLGGYNYSAQRVQEGDEPRIPSDIGFARTALSPIPGAGLAATGHPRGNLIGYDVGLRFSGYTTSIGDGLYWDGMPRFHGAVRTRFDIAGGMHAFAAAGIGLSDVPIYRYNNDLDNVDRLNKMVPGLRLGGGVAYSHRFFYGEFELAETFGALPKVTNTGILIEGRIPVGPVSIVVFVEEDLEFQHMRYWVGTGDSRDRVRIRARQATTLFGAGVAF